MNGTGEDGMEEGGSESSREESRSGPRGRARHQNVASAFIFHVLFRYILGLETVNELLSLLHLWLLFHE